MLTLDEEDADIVENYQFPEEMAAANRSRWERRFLLDSTLKPFAQ